MFLLRLIPVVALLVAGCGVADRQAVVNQPSAADRAAERGPVSKEDISAAVLAARQSKYFPNVERYDVGSANQQQITILYYDMPGTCVFVKRIHGRWKAVGSSFWMP